MSVVGGVGSKSVFPIKLHKLALAATCANWSNESSDNTKAILEIWMTDTINLWETCAGHKVTQLLAVGNFVSVDRIQVDRIRLW